MRWSDRLFAARDRLLSDPAFQRWAARFPLTRPIAARRARNLFDLTAGFVYSQILAASVKLGLLNALADGPRTIADLALTLMLPEPATARLVKAAAALGLVAPRGATSAGAPRYGLGMDGAALLGNPGALAMIEHHALLYEDLADPVALLRGDRATKLAAFWPYASGAAQAPDAQAVAAYSALMASSQSLVCDEILDAYDFAAHRRLLDIGGGDGAFIAAVARRAPNLDLTLFDLPAVADRAAQRVAAAGLSTRVKIVGGDAWGDTLPPDADIVTLVRVLHDHDDDRAQALLARVREALQPGGTLLIAEPMSGGRDGGRIGDAYFGFYLLAMGSGRARTPDEIASLLRQAGFARIERRRTTRPMLTSMMVAHAK